MNVWFMYDCHLFDKIGDGATTREAMEAKARECFSKDGCGSIFARGVHGAEVSLHGKPKAGGGYGVTDAELAIFFDRVDERANWEARG